MTSFRIRTTQAAKQPLPTFQDGRRDVCPIGTSYLTITFKSQLPDTNFTPIVFQIFTAANMTGLQILPPELIELVVIRLNFQDMCSMRLVSRDISAKSKFGVVKSDFAAETVILTSGIQMRNLVAKTAKGWKGCLTDHLSIVALILPQEEAVNITSMPSWASLSPMSRLHPYTGSALFQVFANHRRHSPHGYLDTLSLRVKQRRSSGRIVSDIDVGNWSTIWETAGLAYLWVMRALSQSGLSVRHLDVFGSDSPRCSLAFDWFRKLLPNIDVCGLRASLHTLTHLSIGLSNSVISQSQVEQLTEHESSRTLASLVASCPPLTSLHVRWYENAKRNSRSNAQQLQDEEALLRQLTKAAPESLLRLRDCHFQGAYSTEIDLLACIECVPCLQTLSLEELHLVEGSFAPVFRRLTGGQQKDLQQVHLKDLWEQAKLICFSAPGEPPFPTSQHQLGPTNITWLATAPEKAIEYEKTRGRPRGSYEFARWIENRRAQYGPP